MALSPRRALAVALCLLALASFRIVSTYDVFSTTADEPAHIASGLEYVANHVYKLETQHPPLTRALIALLPYLAGTRPRGIPNIQNEGWAILTYERQPERTLFLMRLGNLPFFLLGGLVVFFWARRSFNPATGVLATLLYTLLTPVLAHAGLATTDMGLAACLGAAFLSLLVWAEEPTRGHAVVFGLCAALASLTKFTALAFLPSGVLLALLAWLGVERPAAARIAALARERAGTFGIAVLTGVLVWWAAFFFSFGKVPVWNITTPAPEFFDGIRSVLQHNATGHTAYLLGRAGNNGWWYYFPVAVGVKTPLAFLATLSVGVALAWRYRRMAWLLPLAFSLGVLLPAMQGRINIGVRHVLPVYIGFSVLAGAALAQSIAWSERRKWVGALAAIGVVWLAAAGLLHHPDYIPYFNELVTGPPDRVLVDSDYDWGQDNKRLAARLRQVGATQLNFGTIKSDDQAFLEAFPGLPHITPIHPLKPADGWTAVSPTLERTAQYGLEYRYPGVQPWFDLLPPQVHQERIGTLTLFYLPPGTVNSLK